MRIVICINNKSIADVDCSDLTKGNPGIGGTEYCILLLAQLYKRYYPDNQITLIASSKGILPEVDDIVIEIICLLFLKQQRVLQQMCL